MLDLGRGFGGEDFGGLVYILIYNLRFFKNKLKKYHDIKSLIQSHIIHFKKYFLACLI